MKNWKIILAILFALGAVGAFIGSSYTMDEYLAGRGSWHGPDDDLRTASELLKYLAYACVGLGAIFSVLAIIGNKKN